MKLQIYANKFFVEALSADHANEFASQTYDAALSAYRKAKLYLKYTESLHTLLCMKRDYCIFLQDMGVTLVDAERAADLFDVPHYLTDQATAKSLCADLRAQYMNYEEAHDDYFEAYGENE